MELADEWIDLSQTQGRLRVALQIPAHEAIVIRFDFQSSGACIVEASNAILLGERQQALNAADGWFSLQPMQRMTQCADVRSGFFGARQQLYSAQWSPFRPVLVLDPMAAALLA
jgi:hypothetical protein